MTAAPVDEAQMLLQYNRGDNIYGPASAPASASLTEARAIIEELGQLAAEERQATEARQDSLPAAARYRGHHGDPAGSPPAGPAPRPPGSPPATRGPANAGAGLPPPSGDKRPVSGLGFESKDTSDQSNPLPKFNSVPRTSTTPRNSTARAAHKKRIATADAPNGVGGTNDEDEGDDAAWTEPLASEAFCQYDGRGKFLPVWLELSPDGSFAFKSGEGCAATRV